jgi:hypothetical protein
MRRTQVLVMSAVCLFLACRKGDAVPAYLVIPEVKLSATDAEGGSTSKITDIWVSVNDKDLGVWELPARIPVLAEGTNVIRIAAGVKKNGAFDDRSQYPYFGAWQGGLTLVREQSVNVDATVHYNGARIWAERFDDAGTSLNRSADSDTTLILYNPVEYPGLSRNGSICGGFVLEPDRDHIQLYTDQNFDAAYGPVFIELDYSTDVNLTIGYIYLQNGSTVFEPWLVLTPTTGQGGVSWNKVYIDATTMFNTSGISNRDLYLQADLPAGQSSAHVYLDDLKLVRGQ